MPAIACPITGCTYVTGDVDVAVAAALLTIHNNAHSVPTTNKQKPPKIDRPKVSKGSSEETWTAFQTRWKMFKDGTDISNPEIVQHLFQCCDEDLGDDILKSHPTAMDGSEQDFLYAIKRLAVIPIAVSVRRSELLSIRQDHGESIRSFYARVNGKAATCAYSKTGSGHTCTQEVD